jgi:hypothetical protein
MAGRIPLVLTEASSGRRLVSRRICERLSKDGEIPQVTVSVGAAVFPQDGDTSTLYSMQPTGRFTA